ncbi:MAG: type II toxin-antitoxin system VapC family toxin [Chloroflexi bacterium]|nr:type II toxin-antitoxin system VapC family toxin [Chloroflexota bacterium]
MPKRPRVLDSWAVMEFFVNHPAAGKVEELIADAPETGTPLLISVVNWGEVWYSTARAHSESEAERVVRELENLRVEVVDATREITRQAAIYKVKGGIAYADCYAAAVAKLRRAELVTGDPEFKPLEGDVRIVWL